MKNTIIILTLIMVIVTLAGCDSTSISLDAPTITKTPTSTGMVTPIPTNTPIVPTPMVIEVMEEDDIMLYPTPSDNFRNEDGSIRKDIMDVEFIQLDSFIRYIDDELGYSLDFPEYWKDNMLIRGFQNYDDTRFNFFGKSVLGQGYNFIFPRDYGIYMFSIVPEDSLNDDGFYDDLGFVGTAKGIDYYAISSLDCPQDILDSEVERIKKGKSSFQDDEEQMELTLDDGELSLKMFNDIRSVLETFKEIE